jgi:flagellar protein FliS
MFGSSKGGAKAYANVGVETGVSSASPHKLVILLFDGALMSVTNAMQLIKLGNVSGKGQSISKAISIIDTGLRASLDKTVGGAIAVNLDALYAYMSTRLLTANLNSDVTILQEVHGLLMELKTAWDAIGQQAEVVQEAAPPLKAPSEFSTYAPTLMKA